MSFTYSVLAWDIYPENSTANLTDANLSGGGGGVFVVDGSVTTAAGISSTYYPAHIAATQSKWANLGSSVSANVTLPDPLVAGTILEVFFVGSINSLQVMDAANNVYTCTTTDAVPSANGKGVLTNSNNSLTATSETPIPTSWIRLQFPTEYSNYDIHKFPVYLQLVTGEPSMQAVSEIVVTGVSIQPASPIVYVGQTLQLKTTVTPPSACRNMATWKVSSAPYSVATLDASTGLLTGVAVGEAMVTVTALNGVEGNARISVQAAPVAVTTVNIKPLGSTFLVKGGTLGMEAWVSPANATDTNLTWSATPSSIASIQSSSGYLVANGGGVGKVTVMATAASGAKGTVDIVVVPKQVMVTSVSVAPASPVINVGDTLTMSAVVQPTNATDTTPSWSVTPSNVASIEETTGQLTALAQGTATVTCTVGTVTAHTKVTITAPVLVTSVAIKPVPSTPLNVGDTVQMSATVQPSNAANQALRWGVTPAAVASIDPNTALLTAVGAGTATVTATSENGFIGEMPVLVILPVKAISIQKPSSSQLSTRRVQLSATITPADATDQTLTWSMTPSSVASINSQTGVVTTTASQDTTVTVTATAANGIAASLPLSLTVEQTTVAIQPIPSIVVGDAVQMTVIVQPSKAPITWTVSPNTVASIDASSGKLTALGAGTATVTATTSNGAKGTLSVPVSVVPVTSVSVRAPPSSVVPVHGTLQLSADVQPSNATNTALRWSVAPSAVASIDSTTGLLTALGVGKATVTVQTVDGGFISTSAITVASAATKKPKSKTPMIIAIVAAAIVVVVIVSVVIGVMVKKT